MDAHSVDMFDVVGEDVMPFLLHLGDQNRAPTVYDVNGFFDPPPGADSRSAYIDIEYVDGERWSTVLSEEPSDYLASVAESLGQSIGYMAQHGVIHGDLHTSNVIVTAEEEQPVIIDWDAASHEEDSDTRHYEENPDVDLLQRHTERVLERHGRRDLYPRITDHYRDGFEAGVSEPWHVTPETLQAQYQELIPE